MDSLQDICDYYSCAFPVDAECGHLKTEHKPSYAAAIIRVKDDVLEYITFADCYVVLKNGEQITVLRDERWANRPKSDPKVMQAFLDMTEDEKLQNQIRSRSNMNKPDGYWIGTADGEAFKHNTPKTISVTPETEIILCSDGFEAAVDYGLYTWSEIFQTPLEKVLHDIRTAEQNDAAKTMYPRVKISDDATAIRLGF